MTGTTAKMGKLVKGRHNYRVAGLGGEVMTARVYAPAISRILGQLRNDWPYLYVNTVDVDFVEVTTELQTSRGWEPAELVAGQRLITDAAAIIVRAGYTVTDTSTIGHPSLVVGPKAVR